MSRRGGPIFIQGHSYPCRVCGSLIAPGEPILCLPWAPFPKWEPMANFEAMLCHPACWASWPYRERFTDLFNRYAGDAVLRPDGSIDYLGPDGEVTEHQDRVAVVAQRHAEPSAAADPGRM
jgi:hypothetical protein